MDDRLREGILSRYVTSQLGQLSFASLRGRLIDFGWGKGGNVTSAGWQVIPRGMWVPVAVWQPCELLYTCYLLSCYSSSGLFLYIKHYKKNSNNNRTEDSPAWKGSDGSLSNSLTKVIQCNIAVKIHGTSASRFAYPSGLWIIYYQLGRLRLG